MAVTSPHSHRGSSPSASRPGWDPPLARFGVRVGLVLLCVLGGLAVLELVRWHSASLGEQVFGSAAILAGPADGASAGVGKEGRIPGRIPGRGQGRIVPLSVDKRRPLGSSPRSSSPSPLATLALSVRGRLVASGAVSRVCLTANHCVSPAEWDRLQLLIDCWGRPGRWVARPDEAQLWGRAWRRDAPRGAKQPEGLDWAWQPSGDAASCALEQPAPLEAFYKGDFCAALGGRRILFVGEAVCNDMRLAVADGAAPGGRVMRRPPPSRARPVAPPAGRPRSPASPAPTPSPEEDYGEAPTPSPVPDTSPEAEGADAAAEAEAEAKEAKEAERAKARARARAEALLASEKDSIGADGGANLGEGEAPLQEEDVEGEAEEEAAEEEGAAAEKAEGGGNRKRKAPAPRSLERIPAYAESPICDKALATVTEFRRNDRLSWDGERLPRARSQGFYEFPWLESVGRAGVIVLARPVNPEPDELYFKQLRSTLTRLRATVPHALLIVRNVVPPHVDCSGATAPLIRRQSAALLGEHAVIHGQNEALRVFLRVEFPGVIHLDVASATSLRPDMHTEGSCRDYKAPGPIDHWARLLANVIELVAKSKEKGKGGA